MRAFLILLLLAPPAFALDPSRAISQYGHTVWTVQEGFLPGAPTEMAQTADGYLWVGTRSGLVRFDGVRFVPFTPPPGEKLRSSRILSLGAGRDGSLWIGTRSGLHRYQRRTADLLPGCAGMDHVDPRGSYRARSGSRARASATTRVRCAKCRAISAVCHAAARRRADFERRGSSATDAAGQSLDGVRQHADALEGRRGAHLAAARNFGCGRSQRDRCPAKRGCRQPTDRYGSVPCSRAAAWDCCIWSMTSCKPFVTPGLDGRKLAMTLAVRRSPECAVDRDAGRGHVPSARRHRSAAFARGMDSAAIPCRTFSRTARARSGC